MTFGISPLTGPDRCPAWCRIDADLRGPSEERSTPVPGRDGNAADCNSAGPSMGPGSTPGGTSRSQERLVSHMRGLGPSVGPWRYNKSCRKVGVWPGPPIPGVANGPANTLMVIRGRMFGCGRVVMRQTVNLYPGFAGAGSIPATRASHQRRFNPCHPGNSAAPFRGSARSQQTFRWIATHRLGDMVAAAHEWCS